MAARGPALPVRDDAAVGQGHLSPATMSSIFP